MQRACVEERGRRGHKPKRAERIVKLNRTLLLVTSLAAKPMDTRM